MSKISDIHAALIARLTAILPGYNRLTNPYDFEDNNELYLTKGFGVGVGAGVRTDRLISCQKSWERTFFVLLTNQITSTDHNLAANETIQKSLLEDHFLVFEDLEKETTLSALCIKSEVDSDEGIEFVSGDIARYYLMQINIICEYLEDLS